MQTDNPVDEKDLAWRAGESRIPDRDTWEPASRFTLPEPPDPIVLIDHTAHEQIWAQAHAAGSSETGGMLLGESFVINEKNTCIVARHAIPAIGGVGTAGSFRFTAEAISYILTEQEEKFPELIIVGWYHSHPSYGIFLSKEFDTFICDQWFKRDDQFALVVDPVANTEGVFIRRDGLLLADHPFGYWVYHESVDQGDPNDHSDRRTEGKQPSANSS